MMDTENNITQLLHGCMVSSNYIKMATHANMKGKLHSLNLLYKNVVYFYFYSSTKIMCTNATLESTFDTSHLHLYLYM